MKKMFILMLLTSSNVYSDEIDCLTEIMFSEARGEPEAGIIAVAEASVNRGKIQKRNMCFITGVTRKKISSVFKKKYRDIAKNVIKNKTNFYAKKADSWEIGKPSYKGKVTAKIGKHAFYKQKK